jgi:hypothetical protein
MPGREPIGAGQVTLTGGKVPGGGRLPAHPLVELILG